ncbi:hypothetical protein F66182_17808 [Fusarium sp. NRRL 66182]|nr:hypothetical protein F66182_17808 [Fusarium sp. NRRL 66182]
MDAEPDQPSDQDDTLQVKAHTSVAVTQRSSRRQSSQIPQTNHKPTLSIQEKLAAVEAEAKEAAEDATGQDSKKRSRNKRDPAPKKTKSRRRSTLTNDELDQLLGVSK